MPNLSEHQSSLSTKMLLIGDSGSGKTGALASLANAGYLLRILDTDNGLDVLSGVISDPKGPYKRDCIKNIEYQTITEHRQVSGGKSVPSGDAWTRLCAQLEHWRVDGQDLGRLTSWGPEYILVLDSMTFAGMYAMNFVLKMNGRLGQRPHQSDWYDGQQLLEALLQILYDDAVKCNVIVTSHIAFIGDEGAATATGYPMALGKALPPKIGRYFNTVLLARSTRSGLETKRQILTSSTRMGGGMVELKTTIPFRVPAEYPLASGLADYFAAIRQQGGQKSSNASK